MKGSELPGAFVVSLDFELAWGLGDLRDRDSADRARLLGARAVVPLLLEIFEEFDVAATWAVVGFLFAESRADLERMRPDVRPGYLDPALSSYGYEVGEDEIDDPLHFAPSLIREIHRSPRQEIATHTLSHYYCLEAGQSREAFAADLRTACAIANRSGLRLRSIVFPRNQHNPDYDDVLLAHGIRAYRGNPRNRAWDFDTARESRRPLRRGMRLVDGYLPITGPGTIPWDAVVETSGLADVRASRPLAPYRPGLRGLEETRMRRIRGAIRHAARNGELFHLWWHPHNFGLFPRQNLGFLRRVLEEMDRCRREYGLLSLSMAEVDRLSRERLSGNPLQVLGLSR